MEFKNIKNNIKNVDKETKKKPNLHSTKNVNTEIVPPEYLECLEKHFGHRKFRTMQWKVIESILNEARDNVAVMATGYGKSLCFQFPSVFLNKITIVISPLISLMEDQVHSLSVMKIRACFLGSAQKDRTVIEKIVNMEYNMVYVTPEFITTENGFALLRRIQSSIVLFAVDEAHCISKWGHDFRSAFRQLKEIRRRFPEIPILASTATATKAVQLDIVENLELKNPQILCTGFDRPNLEFILRQKSSSIWLDIKPYLKDVENGSTIIYCITRNNTETVTAEVLKHHSSCASYHAGLSIDERKAVHQDFLKDRVRVIVATIAFGMGIDKPDVRLIIHYGCSKDIESYYQEVGRAGRDGLPAKCVMFHSRADWNIHQMVAGNSYMSTDYKNHLEKLSQIMVQYTLTTECRRKFILNYFEDENILLLERRKNCCDNCRKIGIDYKSMYEGIDKDGKLDVTTCSLHLLDAINEMDGRFGLTKVILLLKGSKSQTLPARYHNHRLSGVGADKKEEWYKTIADHLQCDGYIQKRTQHTHARMTYQTIELTTKGSKWLQRNDRPKIKIVPTSEIIRLLKPKLISINKPILKSQGKQDKEYSLSHYTINDNNCANENIRKALLKVRSELSRAWDCMPYAIASNIALDEMADMKPTNVEAFKNCKLNGFSEAKIKSFGPLFINCIREFLKLELLPYSKDQGVIDLDKPPDEIHQPVLELVENAANVNGSLSLPNIERILPNLVETRSIKDVTQSQQLSIDETSHAMISVTENTSLSDNPPCEEREISAQSLEDGKQHNDHENVLWYDDFQDEDLMQVAELAEGKLNVFASHTDKLSEHLEDIKSYEVKKTNIPNYLPNKTTTFEYETDSSGDEQQMRPSKMNKMNVFASHTDKLSEHLEDIKSYEVKKTNIPNYLPNKTTTFEYETDSSGDEQQMRPSKMNKMNVFASHTDKLSEHLEDIKSYEVKKTNIPNYLPNKTTTFEYETDSSGDEQQMRPSKMNKMSID